MRRHRLQAFALEVVAATATAVAISLVVQLVVARLALPAGTNVPLALNTATAAAVLVALAVLVVRRREERLATPATWVSLAVLTTTPLALMLAGTRHYLFGISGDQSFRVQYLTRFADSPALADMAYAELPPYYPAGWFWVGGRLAALFGTPGWEAYKPYAIATMAVAGVLTFCAWSLVVSRTQAAALAAVTTIIGLRLAAYTPYSWVVSAALPAVAVIALRLLRIAAAGAPPQRWAAPATLVGVALGAAGAIHSLVFWFLGLLLVVLATVTSLRRPSARQRLLTSGRLVLPAVVIGLVALPLVLLVWAPYLVALAERQPESGAAQRFLPESGALWPLPMFDPSVTGALTMAGLVWIVVRFRSSTVAAGLGLVVLTSYGWYALSTVALGAETTLLAFRLEPMIVTALACGGVLATAEAVRLARHRLPAARVTAVATVIAFAAGLALVQSVPERYEWSRAAQFGDYYPSGERPVGPSAPGDAGAWNDELIATIDALTGASPREVVVLSTHPPILTYRPYRAFQTTIAQYANPLAAFAERRELIRSWAAATTPGELLAALDASAPRPPTVFVLERTTDGLRLATTEDAFPAQPNVRDVAIVFNPDLFVHPVFERRDVGPFAVIWRGAQ